MATDTELLDKLSNLLKDNSCKISFNYDHEDGFWCEISTIYSRFNQNRIAELKPHTKNKNLTDAIIATIKFLEA